MHRWGPIGDSLLPGTLGRNERLERTGDPAMQLVSWRVFGAGGTPQQPT